MMNFHTNLKPPPPKKYFIEATNIAIDILEKLLCPKTPEQLYIGLDAIGKSFHGKPSTSLNAQKLARRCDVLLSVAYKNEVIKKPYTSTVSKNGSKMTVSIVDPDTDEIVDCIQ